MQEKYASNAYPKPTATDLGLRRLLRPRILTL